VTRAILLVAALGAVLAWSACSGQQVSSSVGLTEPIRVESGQFLPGLLPGSAPPDASVDAGAGTNPEVTDINVGNTAIYQGERGLIFSGHATTDAQSVGVRFADLGTGYWVIPVGGPDPSDNSLLTWQFSADFDRGLPPGFHDLLFAAIDANGSSGTQADLEVCVDTPVPDNLNICVPKRAPPAAVLSLQWDTPVNLDLLVETPSGATVGGTTAPAGDGGATVADSGGPVLDHVSNANCVVDDIDQEDLVWQGTPETGTYQVWVDLVRACGQPSVSFTVSLWLAETQPDGTKRLVQQSAPIARGVLAAEQANGGAGPGLFVGDFVLQ
jgi:hypothetical protein